LRLEAPHIEHKTNFPIDLCPYFPNKTEYWLICWYIDLKQWPNTPQNMVLIEKIKLAFIVRTAHLRSIFLQKYLTGLNHHPLAIGRAEEFEEDAIIALLEFIDYVKADKIQPNWQAFGIYTLRLKGLKNRIMQETITQIKTFRGLVVVDNEDLSLMDIQGSSSNVPSSQEYQGGSSDGVLSEIQRFRRNVLSPEKRVFFDLFVYPPMRGQIALATFLSHHTGRSPSDIRKTAQSIKDDFFKNLERHSESAWFESVEYTPRLIEDDKPEVSKYTAKFSTILERIKDQTPLEEPLRVGYLLPQGQRVEGNGSGVTKASLKKMLRDSPEVVKGICGLGDEDFEKLVAKNTPKKV